MPLRSYRPTSPGLRQMTRSTFDEITKDTPHKPLTERSFSKAGRNAQGKLTVRHQGSGHKRLYRIIDWKRDKPGVPARIATVEYDPNRSARIGLLHYADGEKRYMLLPHGLGVGDRVVSGPDAEARTGNALPLSRMPLGTQVHNIELVAGRGGQIVRSAGSSAQLLAKEGEFATLRLPSGRGAPRAHRLHGDGGPGEQPRPREPEARQGRPQRATWASGPRFAASVMNPRDHPHGGGEGKSPTGMPPKTPWGKPAMGLRTRARKNASNKMIVRRRYGRG